MSAGYWAAEGIRYAVANGLMTGTSATTFAPAATTTRGMLMTVLARQAGEDTTGGSVWYEKGMEWAKTAGVSDGTNPGGAITREQLATMLFFGHGDAFECCVQQVAPDRSPWHQVRAGIYVVDAR